MEKQDWLDHSSIYSQKHHTFYRWVLYPIIILLLLIGLFLICAKREVVIRTSAQLTAIKTKKIQVPVNSKILDNKLAENKKINKGETLVVFDSANLSNEKQQLEQENKKIDEQKKAAQLFIDSLNQSSNLFSEDDAFGYSNQLKSLLAEETSSNYVNKQSSETNQKTQQSYQQTKIQLSQQLSAHQNEQNEWSNVRSAWTSQQNIQGFSNEIQSKYQSWQYQLSDTPEEQKNQIKTTILATIDEQIAQLKKEIEQIQGEQAKLVAPPDTENEIKSQNEKMKQTKEQALASTKQKLSELVDTHEKNETALKSLAEQINLSTLIAPTDGIVHVNDEVKGQLEVSKGTLLAEIYPDNPKEKLSFTALIPANEMTPVKTGMKVHFKLDKKGIASTTMNGTLTEISETSTTSKQGTFYTVKGDLTPPKNGNNRYGLTGELSLIVGKKTYWNSIKDILLNRE
ncbi:competence factor transport accessory protein ComB [Enterococcus malodoratus]|uniref:bacteriocin secretion accessory protein n=1 Tax=Enterococcus malodoratus TaxID=71451 RepID=UPI0008B841F7|nr:bacteriocin secretion accessory protein [Enterococcus malodoratus]SEU01945.1 competence factor transport accessory protein ComB [Enterococcus malodoratus]